MNQLTFVKTRDEDGVRILTIDNPPVNTLSAPVLEDLEKAVEEAGLDSTIKCIIVTGAGNRSFSNGFDLRSLRENPVLSDDIVRLGQRTFNKLANLAKPVIAAVNGLALGGGNELCMACDIRVSSDKAQFGQPEVNRGLIPAWGGTQRMPRLIGVGKAKELILTGQMINAQEAHRIGLINSIVPEGEELKMASDMAHHIIQRCAPLAVSAAKKAINQGLQKTSMDEALEVEVASVREVATSADLREGVNAFFSKRLPVFHGE